MGCREVEVATLDDAENAGRWVKCELEKEMEFHPDSVVTVTIDIETVGLEPRE